MLKLQDYTDCVVFSGNYKILITTDFDHCFDEVICYHHILTPNLIVLHRSSSHMATKKHLRLQSSVCLCQLSIVSMTADSDPHTSLGTIVHLGQTP